MVPPNQYLDQSITPKAKNQIARKQQPKPAVFCKNEYSKHFVYNANSMTWEFFTGDDLQDVPPCKETGGSVVMNAV